MQRLTGKTCLITAAGQGIGRAACERLAAEGGRVIATDLNPDSLAGLDGVEQHRLDVMDKAAVEALITQIRTVDVLFNCAGIVDAGTIQDATEEQLDFAFDLNVKAQFRMIRAVLPGMLEKGCGSIINMSSVVGPKVGTVNRVVYSTTKAAVAGMTRAVAHDYVKQGIRCNAIAPGTVDTPSLHQRLEQTGDYDAALNAFMARQPMGRLGTAQEIAALVAYLAADESAYTTGAVHLIDGGWSA